MRIVQIIPGAGPRFYCENCARDGSLVSALRSRGHEVIVGSLYLPLTASLTAAQNGPAPPPPVFYGAVNLYLRQRFPAFRLAPPWVERLFDSEALLRLAGGLSGATDAAGLEDLTLSMLRGEEGAQAAELDRLVRWLAEVRPEVVHLSNCLLLGTARRIRRELGIPVTCSLQDEDTWIDSMGEQKRRLAWGILRERSADVDLFTPVSTYYAGFMAERMAIPPERLAVVPIGIDMEGFREAPSGLPFEPPVIGFLAHIAERMGAGLLADAFVRLAASGGFPGLRLHFMGGSTAGDAPLLRSMRRSLARQGLQRRMRVWRPFGPQDRIRFLTTVTVLSVPVPNGEAFGTFILEALAAGVPVVQPRLGGFPELVEATGGGLLYEPNTPEALAATLGGLLADRDRARRLGHYGRAAVVSRFTAAHMAAALEAQFGRLLEATGRARR
jgi:glycosyltransferase involved in cell wall biosynthesis